MKAINTTRNEIIAHNLEFAETLLRRMIGLLGRASMEKGSGLLIRPCKCIHTFGMKIPIDAIFLDKEKKAIGTVKNILPNRISPFFLKAVAVIELPAGAIEESALQIGDYIEIV